MNTIESVDTAARAVRAAEAIARALAVDALAAQQLDAGTVAAAADGVALLLSSALQALDAG
jgi:hypothetical protein